MTDQNRTTNAVLIELTPDIIAALLQLPDDAHVTGAAWKPLNRRLILRIDAPYLPDVLEGSTPRLVELEDLLDLADGHDHT